MTIEEIKNKICPLIGRTCIAPACMSWKFKRRILPYHVSLTEAIQKRYKNIEVIQYDGISLITILDGECKIFKDEGK